MAKLGTWPGPTTYPGAATFPGVALRKAAGRPIFWTRQRPGELTGGPVGVIQRPSAGVAAPTRVAVVAAGIVATRRPGSVASRSSGVGWELERRDPASSDVRSIGNAPERPGSDARPRAATVEPPT
jgi:hypothetical protein